MRWMGIAAGVVLIGVAVGLFFLYSQTEVERALKRGEWVHVLVVGLDNGAQGRVQADLVGVASLSPEGRAVWITVPSDLQLPTGDGTWAPLNSLYSGSPAELAQVVGSLLELPLRYWVALDFEAFRKLVERVGGVEVVVEERLRYTDRSQGLEIDIPQGAQRLDGERALQYLRYRAEDGEPDRAQRTSKFIRALWDKLQGLPWSRWRGLVELASQEATTNLTLWEGIALATRLRGLPGERLTFATCPAAGSPPRPDLVRTRELLARLYRGEERLTRDEVRVEVLNGAGVPLLATRTRAWLLARGFQVVGVGNADRSDYRRTLVVYAPGAEDKAELLAQVLPVSPELMAADTFGTDRLGGWPAGADLVLILGEGFDVGD